MPDKIMHASKVGFPCDRNLWYSVNDGYNEKISSRSQRIFDVGSFLEPLAVQWLQHDGWLVFYNPGSQNAKQEVSIPVRGGKLIGHFDAVIWKNFVGSPILVDIKTMNDRAFTLWKRSGTIEKYPQYVDQLHVYAAGLDRKFDTLGIVGINKNTSDFYIDQSIQYDDNRTKNIISRTERIFDAKTPPDPGDRMQDWCCNYCGFSWLCELFQNKHDTHVGNDIAITNSQIILDAIELLKEARELSNAGKDLEDEAKKVLNENVRQKNIKQIKCGNFLLSLKEVNGKVTFDTKAFSETHPDLAAQFTKIGNSYIKYEIKELV